MGLPGPLHVAVGAWSEYAEGHVSHVAKAAGYVRFALSLDKQTGRRVVEPRHYVIAFPMRDQGRTRHHSALFTLRIVREEEIERDPNAQGAVANHLRFKPPAERKKIPGADEYVEFELLSREHEIPSQQPLRISMGPVRADKATGRKEFVRVDMGQCIQQIATDVLEDSSGGPRLVQHRWWMCIETLRLLCNVDHIDCSALDEPGAPPQEWVIRLMDTHAPINKKEELQDRDIDDIMEYIDSSGPGRGSGRVSPSHSGANAVAASALSATATAGAVPPTGAAAGAGAGAAAGAAASAGGSSRAARARRRKAGKEKDPSGGPPQQQQAPGRPAEGAGADDARQGPAEASVAAGPEVSSDAPVEPQPAQAEAASEGAGSAAAACSSSCAGRAALREDECRPEDADLIDTLMDRYRRLQERSGRVEVESKVAAVRELLEVLDELERADAELQEDSPASRLIFSAARKFEAKLRSMGFTRVAALGKPFDRAVHKAVGASADEGLSGDQGVVVEELESGWLYGTELVRPALVTLG